MSLKLLFELSKAGSNKFSLPEIDVPVVAEALERFTGSSMLRLPVWCTVWRTDHIRLAPAP